MGPFFLNTQVFVEIKIALVTCSLIQLIGLCSQRTQLLDLCS